MDAVQSRTGAVLSSMRRLLQFTSAGSGTCVPLEPVSDRHVWSGRTLETGAPQSLGCTRNVGS